MSNDEFHGEIDPSKLLTLLDAQTVRLTLPPLSIEGLAEPLNIHLDFDRGTVEEETLPPRFGVHRTPRGHSDRRPLYQKGRRPIGKSVAAEGKCDG